jgi:multiple antibiotic resistance protein
MNFSFKEIFSVFMVMFAIIDIVGSIPIIIDLKNKGLKVESGKATLVSTLILLVFLFSGEALLTLFGVDLSSFAIAGSFIIFFLAMEMILGVEFFKGSTPDGASVIPLAFPLIAGAGSITSLLSLRAEYQTINIVIAVLLNMIVVYVVLRSTNFLGRALGPTGMAIIRKIFGIILLAIAIRLFMSNVAKSMSNFFPQFFENVSML